MKVRELLQIEIWSKRTTWILLIGIVALVGLGQLGWYTLERFYLSSAEKNAAREALSEIDRLQASGPLTDDAFATEARAAELKIRNAVRDEWTDRDIGVNFLLSTYLNSIRTERILAKKRELSDRSQGNLSQQSDQWQAKMRKSIAEHKSKLHELLD
ncbi:MAG: hypothetical protein ACLP7O_13265 [Terracidiphilus sp.]